MVGRKGDRKKEPPGGRAAERLRQFEEARGYPPAGGKPARRPSKEKNGKKKDRPEPNQGR